LLHFIPSGSIYKDMMNRARLPIIFLFGLLAIWEGLPNLALCQHDDPFHDAHLVAEQLSSPLLQGHYSHKGTGIGGSPLEGEAHCPTSTLIPLSCPAVFFRSISQINPASQCPLLAADLSFFSSPSTKLSLLLPEKVPPDKIQLVALQTIVLLI